MSKKVLVFAPHQDDAVIGCGGLLSIMAGQGTEVKVVYGTVLPDEEGEQEKYSKKKGEYVKYTGRARLQETKDALEVLGIEFMPFEADDSKPEPLIIAEYHHKLDAIPVKGLLERMEKMVERFKPDMVFLPAESPNQDHRKIREVAESLIRPYYYDGDVVEYEVYGEKDFKPNYYVKMTEEIMERKLEAFGKFKTQDSGGLHPVSERGIKAKAITRGLECYSEYAEAFNIVRLSEREW